jgi:acetyltransferase-like isoleucine patch superfamily enzyme
MSAARTIPDDWFPGTIPDNVHVGDSAYIQTSYSFQLFRSRRPSAIEIGKAASIYLGVMFDLGSEAHVKIGAFTLINGARIISDREITIGEHCLISWNVVLMDTYRFSFEASGRRKQLEEVAHISNGARTTSARVEPEGGQAVRFPTADPIHIGANVWIGFDSCILPGVRIGDGSVVGARSVVVEDVPPLTVVAGNPARIIRTL